MMHHSGGDPHDTVGQFLSMLAGRAPIETHLSEVYVGSNTVWKRKKPVRLAFADFTSGAARRGCLMREFALNAPQAPGLYRDVVAVVAQADGHLSFSPDAAAPDALDWVLRMAHVPETAFLDRRAVDGLIDDATLLALGDRVAEMHASQPTISGWDSAAAMQRVITGNATAARAAGLPESDVTIWQTAAEAERNAQEPWLTARAAGGFVRRAHGDLHLGNICVWQGRLAPFDALEFDEDLATIDVGYDLAFLLMDLEHRVHRIAANRVLNRYVARTGDAELVVGLKLFLSVRAMVRAHVRAASGDAAGASAYLRTAISCLQAKPQQNPAVLALGGLPGTGKSTVARVLAPLLGPAPGALVLRSDEWRKRLHAVCPEQPLPQSAYTQAATAETHAAVQSAALAAARGGHCVIVDATFLDPPQRDSLRAACDGAGLRFQGVWLDAPLPVLLARVRARQANAIRDASDATEDVLQRAATCSSFPADWPHVSTVT
jgi:aminoglycoside phosphotransferase family enzyme/predicted kinase